jgi:D-alanyl-D-alanine carboxypeptidase
MRSLVAAVAALIACGGLLTPSAQADPLPPLDHAGVLADMQRVVAAGAPAYLFGAIDEFGTWSAAAGVSDVNTGVPASPDAAFRIGSITKTFLAVAILQLVAEGRIGLDDPVDEYLPGLLKQGAIVTIRELLQHRAGLGLSRDPGLGTYGYWCAHDYDPVQVIQAYDDELFPPGSAFSYSNAGYMVLQLVLQKVTGESYQQVLTQRLVDPLHLTNTGFQEEAPVWPNPYVHGYYLLPGTGNAATTHLYDESACRASFFGASGSGISTTRDLTTFLYALTHGQLLPDYLYQQMIQTLPTNLAPYITYGLGLEEVQLSCGVTLLGNGGHVPGYISDVFATLDGTRTYADVFTIDNPNLDVVAAWHDARHAEFCDDK